MRVRSANLNIVMRAAHKAGRALVRDFGEIEQLQTSRQAPANFAATAERKAGRILMEELQKARPDHGIDISGMAPASASATAPPPSSDLRFIATPLDGLTNYMHGLPHWAVSVALAEKNTILCASIYDPIKDETFWTERGQGAFVNDSRLRTSARRRLDDALIGCGDGNEPWTGRCVGLRRWGATALDLAYVAAGRLDGYRTRDAAAGAVAAGVLLVREAGGMVSDAEGRDYQINMPDLAAAAGGIHNALLALIRDADG